MTLFPRKGDAIRAHSVFFQAGQVRDRDIGVTANCGVTRASASSVTIASGSYKYNNTIYSYAGATLTGIPAAGSGKHRYDIVVLECSTGNAKYIQGSEDIADPFSGGFLNNLHPSPPELENENQILLAVYKVTSSGIPDENYGNYCVGGVANVQPLLSSKLGVTGGDAHKTRHQYGGADAIKLDDLAAPDDNTDLNASTSKHGLMQKYPNTAQALKGDGSWITRYFEIDFPFGNGSDVIETGQVQEVGVPINCLINRIDLWEVGLISSSFVSSFYIRDIGSAIPDSAYEVRYDETTYRIMTGLGININAHKILGIKVTGIDLAKQVVVRLFCEAT